MRHTALVTPTFPVQGAEAFSNYSRSDENNTCDAGPKSESSFANSKQA
ncbi:MAG TPA: hypothetical protein V6D19_21830 [Stenomitos sp.]